MGGGGGGGVDCFGPGTIGGSFRPQEDFMGMVFVLAIPTPTYARFALSLKNARLGHFFDSDIGPISIWLGKNIG